MILGTILFQDYYIYYIYLGIHYLWNNCIIPNFSNYVHVIHNYFTLLISVISNYS